MEKTAQKRSILNKLREMTNVSGIAAEKFFNPEFERVMNSLRDKDDQIRSIVSGEKIGDHQSEGGSLKQLLKDAKSSLNKREYMTAVAQLGVFHKTVFDIVQIIKSLDLDVDKVHHEFLFKDLDETRKKQLLDLKSKFSSINNEYFIKDASIMDFFHNLYEPRGRALSAWEKRYPEKVGKLKKETIALLSRSSNVLDDIISTLKEMASARAVRNVDNYVKAAGKIIKSYDKYDAIFKNYYVTNVKNFLEKVNLEETAEKLQNTDIGAEPKQPVPDIKAPSIPKPPSVPDIEMPAAPVPLVKMVQPDPFAKTQPSPPPSNMESNPPSVPPTNTPTIPGMGPVDEFKSDQVAQEMWGKKSAHQKFINSLETMADEDPVVIANHIRMYARSIKLSDFGAAVELLKLARSIEG